MSGEGESGWTRGAYRVCWVLTAAYNLAWGVLFPLRNLYLREPWINLSFERIGWLGFIRASAMMLCPPLFGLATDRAGFRKPWILTGFAMSGVAALQYLAVRGFWSFAAIVFLGTASFVSYHLNINALVTMTLDDRARGRQYGQYRISGSIGYALSSSLLIPLLMRDSTYTAAFMTVSGIYFACALIAGAFLREPAGLAEGSSRPRGALREALGQRNLLALYGCFAFGAVGSSMGMEFFPNHLEETFRMGKGEIGRVVSLQALFEIPPLILLGWLSDRWGRKPILIGASLAGSARWLLIGWASSVGWVAFAQTLWGLGFAGFTVGVALITDLAPERSRGSALGFYQFSWAAGYSIGPPIGGYLADRFGLPSVFWAAGAIGAVSAVGLALLLRSRPLHRTPEGSPDRPRRKAAASGSR